MPKGCHLLMSNFRRAFLKNTIYRVAGAGLFLNANRSTLAQINQSPPGSFFHLLNGQDLSAWNQLGNANWQIFNHETIVSQGSGFLVSRVTLKDFIIKAKYWLDDQANASIYVRCQNSDQISSGNAYQINLTNQNFQQGYGIGSINNLAQALVSPKAIDGWNSITIKGLADNLTVTINDKELISTFRDVRFASGVIAVGYQAGTLKFRSFDGNIPGVW